MSMYMYMRAGYLMLAVGFLASAGDLRAQTPRPASDRAITCPDVYSIPHADEESRSTHSLTEPELHVQLGHGSVVTALSNSPDGSLLISGAKAGDVVMWDLASETEVGRLSDNSPWPVDIVAVNVPKHLLLVNNTCQLTVWDLDSRLRLGYLPEQAIRDIKISDDGGYVAILLKDQVHLRKTGISLELYDAPVTHSIANATALAFSPDGRYLAVATPDGGAEVLNLPDLSVAKIIAGHLDKDHSSQGVGFRRDTGELVLHRWTNAISFIDPQTWKESSTCAQVALNAPSTWTQFPVTFEATDYRIVASGRQLIGIARAASSYMSAVDLMTCKVIIPDLRNSIGWKDAPPIRAIATGADGKSLYIGDGLESSISVRDIKPLKERHLEGVASAVTGVSITQDGKTLLVDSSNEVDGWSIGAATTRAVFPQNAFPGPAWKQGRFLASGEDQKGIFDLRESSTDDNFAGFVFEAVKHPFTLVDKIVLSKRYLNSQAASSSCTLAYPGTINGRSFSLNRQWLLFLTSDEFSNLKANAKWKLEVKSVATCGTTISKRVPEGQSDRPATMVSNDGLLAVIGYGKTVTVYKTDSQYSISLSAAFDTVSTLAFSAEDSMLAVGSQRGRLAIYSLKDHAATVSFDQPVARSSLTCIAFAKDDPTMLFLGEGNGGVRTLQIGPNLRIGVESFEHSDEVTSFAYDPRRKLLVSGSKDGTARVRKIEMPLSLALISYADGRWNTILGDRFDSNSFEGKAGVVWVAPLLSSRPLPLEIFIRDYYEPSLFSRFLEGEAFPALQGMEKLNIAQPVVKIASKVAGMEPDLVDVTLQLTRGEAQLRQSTGVTTVTSDVYDVRLFRAGQLVDQEPKPDPATQPITTHKGVLTQDELNGWRSATHVMVQVDASTGVAQRTFSVRLPHGSAGQDIELSAYAFNADRVKSETDKTTYLVPKQVSPVQRRAYVITMGVNVTQADGWDLTVAVPSAQKAATLWHDRFSKDYEVVPVSLLSLTDGAGEVSRMDATKTNLQAVLNLLAGRERLVSTEVRRQIDPTRRLRSATPDDVVVLHIVSHGYVDPQGRFFVIPFDTGTKRGIDDALLTRCQNNADAAPNCTDAKTFLSRAISSDDLASWWTGVDGGEMVMVLDSCHSGALPGKGFRPGPLGDRGFGQLAYDKGLRIFAATQADKLAHGTVVQGTSTLLVEALAAAAATTTGKGIGAWLQNAERIVPERARFLYPGFDERDLQYPQLMDFYPGSRGEAPTPTSR